MAPHHLLVRWNILLVLGLVLSPAVSGAATLPRVMVTDLQEHEGVAAGTASLLTSYLVEQLRAARAFGQVVSTRDLAQVLTLERQKQLADCDSASCVAELAGALGADVLAAGSVGKMGSSSVLNLRLINARSGLAMSSAFLVVCGATEDGLLRAVAAGAGILVRQAGLASRIPQVAPPPERCGGETGPPAKQSVSSGTAPPSRAPALRRVGPPAGLLGTSALLATLGAGLMLGGVAGLVSLQVPPLLALMKTPGLEGTPRVAVLRAIPAAALVLSLGVAAAAVATGAAATWWWMSQGAEP